MIHLDLTKKISLGFYIEEDPQHGNASLLNIGLHECEVDRAIYFVIAKLGLRIQFYKNKRN